MENNIKQEAKPMEQPERSKSDVKCLVKVWKKCSPGVLRTVDFPLGMTKVKLLSSFKYYAGRVYHVEDIATGHRDFVGIEYLSA